MSSEQKQRPITRRLAAGAVAVFTSASMMVGGIFHPPADLPEQTDILPPPIVLDEDDLDGDGKNKKPVQPEPESEPEPESGTVTPAEAEPALPEEEKKGIRRWWGALSFRKRLLLIPAAALLGWGIFGLGAAFLPGIFGRLAAWLMTLAALAGGFVAAEKAVFPDVPLKKLLSSKNLAGLAVGIAVLGAADLTLPLLWSGYTKLEALFHGLGILAVFGTAAFSFAKKTRRETTAAEREIPEAETEPEIEEPKPMTREEVLALADSVSRKRR